MSIVYDGYCAHCGYTMTRCKCKDPIAKKINDAENKVQRYREHLYDVLELFRNRIGQDFNDWKDADDWLFSNLNITKSELEDIYRGRSIMYIGSVKED